MYEFTHGIDHVGKNGFAPILVIGKKVCEQDFIERDLSGIQGVVIRHRGLDSGVKWQDLNIELLRIKFPRLRYLHIEFGDKCDVSEFGEQSFVEELTLICPKLKQKIDQPQFRSVKKAKLQIPTQYLNNLVSLNIQNLELLRPKFSFLDELPARQLLSKLKVAYGRNLQTLKGIEGFPNLIQAAFIDCPNLTEVGDFFQNSMVREIWLSGVRSLTNIDGLVCAQFLEKAFVIDADGNLVVPNAIRDIVRDRA